MRWLRRALVVLALAAPVIAVAVIAWPEEGSGGGGDDEVREEGSGRDGAVVAGDSIGGELGFGETASYLAIGTGSPLRIGVTGIGFDFTLTAIDEGGDQLAYNDDTNGLDPEVTVDVDEGDEFTIEVRELSGQAAAFTMRVDEVGDDDEDDDVPTETTVADRSAEPSPPTTAAG